MLTTKENVKLTLGIPLSDLSQDSLLNVHLYAADAAIKKWTKRLLEQTTITEYPKGSIIPELVLRHRPLSAYASSGTLVNNSAVITAIPSTSNLVVGMPCTIGVTWSGNSPIPTGTTIHSVDSATQVTLTNAVTASGSAALVFGVAAWIDPEAYAGFGVGSSTGGPFAAITELRCGIDFMPKIDASGMGDGGILVRLQSGSGTGQGSGGFFTDNWWGTVTADYRGTLTAGRSPSWPSGTYGQIKVVYTAGYATVPLDLAQACTEYTVILWRLMAKFGGKLPTSQSYQGYSYSLLADGQTPELGALRQKLMPYRELAVG